MSTRETLLQAAVKVFAKKGFEGATVQDICGEAGVNVSLVSYYFNGKEGIYRTCISDSASGRLAIAKSTLKAAESIEDFKTKLRLWVEQNLEMSVDECDLIKIIHRDFDFENPIAHDLFQEMFTNIFGSLLTFFEKAQKSGILRNDIDIVLAASHFHGGIVHLVRADAITKKVYGKSIENVKYRSLIAKQVVETLLLGISN